MDTPICPLGQTHLIEHEDGLWYCPACGYSVVGLNYMPPAQNQWSSPSYDNDDDGLATV